MLFNLKSAISSVFVKIQNLMADSPFRHFEGMKYGSDIEDPLRLRGSRCGNCVFSDGIGLRGRLRKGEGRRTKRTKFSEGVPEGPGVQSRRVQRPGMGFLAEFKGRATPKTQCPKPQEAIVM